jgi:hypothetical protein
MLLELSYCPNVDAVLTRLQRFYDRKAIDQILAYMDVPTQAIETFAREHQPGYCNYPDPFERAGFWDAHLFERSRVEDDSIPCAYLTEMDQGLYGGLIGGVVQFICDPNEGWISSMVAPILKKWSEFDQLKFNSENKWFRRYIDQLNIFVKKSEKKFCISHFILIDSFNFIFELFGGTNTYLSAFDHPEMVLQAIDYAFKLNVKVQNIFFNSIPLLNGGTCSVRAQWIPGKIVDESIDPFHMTSVDYFERWGIEPVERIFNRFDGGIIHIHGNGHHLLKSVANIRGLKSIYLEDDLRDSSVFERLEKIKKITGHIPLIAEIDFYDFCRALDTRLLPGGIFYIVKKVPDIKSANNCMDRVRAYRV